MSYFGDELDAYINSKTFTFPSMQEAKALAIEIEEKTSGSCKEAFESRKKYCCRTLILNGCLSLSFDSFGILMAEELAALGYKVRQTDTGKILISMY